MYVDYFIREINKNLAAPTEKQRQYFIEFKNNLLDGMEYYRELFPKMTEESAEFCATMLSELEEFRGKLEGFVRDNYQFFMGNFQPAVSVA